MKENPESSKETDDSKVGPAQGKGASTLHGQEASLESLEASTSGKNDPVSELKGHANGGKTLNGGTSTTQHQ